MTLDALTSALESAAVVLIVVSIGWFSWLLVPAPFNGPAALAAAGAAALTVSVVLQWVQARTLRHGDPAGDVEQSGAVR